jgi:hypothetical protein
VQDPRAAVAAGGAVAVAVDGRAEGDEEGVGYDDSRAVGSNFAAAIAAVRGRGHGRDGGHRRASMEEVRTGDEDR